jgi:hypothetical protein
MNNSGSRAGEDLVTAVEYALPEPFLGGVPLVKSVGDSGNETGGKAGKLKKS